VNPPQRGVDLLRHVMVTVILGPAVAAQQGLSKLADVPGSADLCDATKGRDCPLR
jgi:hypothetical protein